MSGARRRCTDRLLRVGFRIRRPRLPRDATGALRRWWRGTRLGRLSAARGGDRGSITAEFAVALPAVLMLLLAGLTAVSAVLTKLECVDAARQAARAAARGDSGVAAGARSAPDDAHVTVRLSGGRAHAIVRAPVTPLGGVLPALSVSADAVAETEPGVGG